MRRARTAMAAMREAGMCCLRGRDGPGISLGGRDQLGCGRGARDRHRTAPAGLAEDDLDGADPALLEAGLAPAQAEPPQPLEALVVAEPGQLRGALLDVRAPAPQRLGVVRGDVLEVDHAQVAAPGGLPGDDLDRR